MSYKLGLTKDQRIASFINWAAEKKTENGFELFFMSFMFGRNLNDELTPDIMRKIIERYYSNLTTRLIKRPSSRPLHKLPLLLAFMEKPSEKQGVIARSKSWGTHFHAALAIPPRTQTRVAFRDVDLKVEDHVRKLNPLLSHVDVSPMRDVVASIKYMLKARPDIGGEALYENDFALPRLRDEITDAEVAARRPYRGPVSDVSARDKFRVRSPLMRPIKKL